MITVNFQCPVCNKPRSVEIDNTGKRGIVSGIVPATAECPHTFIIFVDEDGKPRRIQRIDHLADAILTGEYLPRGMSIRGAWTVFKTTLIDIIACLMVGQPVYLCDDVDVAITLYNSLVRVFHEPIILGKDIIIVDDCEGEDSDSLVVNCRFSVVVKGMVRMDAHRTLKRFIEEAVAVSDNEVAIVLLKQKLSGLNMAVSLLANGLNKKTTARAVLKHITSETRLRFKYEDLYAILMLLRSKGKGDVADMIELGGLDGF